MNSEPVLTTEFETHDWVDVGAVEDIPASGARRLKLGTAEIAVFRTSEDAIFALRNQCPHAGGPLSEGIVHGDCVTCPLHNWVISLSSGEAQGADAGSVDSYPVRLNEDRILIQMDVDQET